MARDLRKFIGSILNYLYQTLHKQLEMESALFVLF